MPNYPIAENYYRSGVLTIPRATPLESDSAQYMFLTYKGQKILNFNLCGEFCVAFCMQDEAHSGNIDDFLAYWEAKSLAWWQSIFYQGKGKVTGLSDIKVMLDDYETDYATVEYFTAVNFKMDVLYPLLKDYQLILGVSIDHTGYLVGQGIRHWEVLDRMTVLDDSHAICDLYNPYTNAMEPYSWRELMTSTGIYKQGLWVKRM